MKAVVAFCDHFEKVYASPVEGAIFLEESTKEQGRWMAHMHVGPEYVKEFGVKAMSEAKCRSEIESKGGYLQV